MPYVLHCLIVEDNFDFAEYLRDCINKMPEKLLFVKHCDSAIDAKKIIETERIDLIFLDLHLSGRMNGVDFLEFSKITQKVIVVSAIPNLIEETFNYKVDGYLKKPYSFEQFQAKINQLNGAETAPQLVNSEPVTSVQKEVEKPYFVKVTDKKEGTDECRLDWDQLVYVQTKNGQVHLHLADGNVWEIWKPTLINLLEEAPLGKCCQVHQSFAVGNPKFFYKKRMTNSELVLKFSDVSKKETTATIPFNKSKYNEQLNRHLGIL